MMNVFDGLFNYGQDSWEVADSRQFTPEEIAAVKSAEVKPSEYGMSVCFFMKQGGQRYIPVSRDSDTYVGEVIDLNKVKLLTLVKEGCKPILRIEI